MQSLLLRLAPALLIAAALCLAPAAARGLKDYQHTVWSEQHGAPADITGLAQTTDGWLWIASSDGLFRFDGVGFEAYAPAGLPELAHMRVVDMHAADNGDLYVSYFPKDVAVIRRDGHAELLPLPKERRRTPPLTMAIDRDGSLWTIGHGIRRYADGQWTTIEGGAEWTNNDFHSLLLDQDGRMWATEPNGAWLLDRKRDH